MSEGDHGNVDQSNNLFERLNDRVESLREDGHEPDKIVVPLNDWAAVKARAERLEGEGVAGADRIHLNGVKCMYNERRRSARVVFEVSADV